MQSIQRVSTTILITVALLFVGCGPEQGADSPEAAMERFLRGAADHDGAEVVAVIKASDVQKQIMRARIDAAPVKQQFREAVIEAYGDEASRQFRLQMLTMTPFAFENVDEMLENMQIEEGEDGNTATASFEGRSGNPELVQEDGRWYVNFSGGNASDEHLAEQLEKANRVASVLEAHMDQIDAESMSLDEFLRKVNNEVNGG